MNLAQRYIKFLDDAHHVLTGLIIIFPACIVAALFFSDTENNFRLLVSGTICSVITAIHICLGFYSLTKRQYWSFLNLMCLPIVSIILMFVFINK
jgi:hypothetical protein